MKEQTPVYRLRNLDKSYPLFGKERLEVLSGIDLDIPRGFSAILGPSGEGKSTLLSLLAALDKPSGGEIDLGGRRIPFEDDRALREVRRHIGLVFQEHNLVSHLTAEENVALPAICQGVSRDRAIADARGFLRELGLSSHLHHRPGKLSGGQKQRVGIARAFAGNAKVILADEPTGNLDRKSAREAMNAFRDMAKDTGTPVIVVTHDEAMAEEYCDRRWRLATGRLHAEGVRASVPMPTLPISYFKRVHPQPWRS